MMRSLWTAASGMTAQQLNIDNISNNISNVNTNGYKKTSLEFRDLLYTNINETVRDKQGNGRPVSLQVGTGVRVGATNRDFSTGNMQETGNVLDFAIEGNGFFSIQLPNGTEKYTKDGKFKISPYEGQNYLVTSDGYQVLNTDDAPISFDSEILVNNFSVDAEGNFTYTDEEGEIVDTGQRMKIVQFTNVLGLQSIGNNLFETTPAVGDIILEDEMDIASKSEVRQRWTEMSNVKIAEEMVNMIVVQRAYELNSKSIQTSDEMLSIANQLKR